MIGTRLSKNNLLNDNNRFTGKFTISLLSPVLISKNDSIPGASSTQFFDTFISFLLFFNISSIQLVTFRSRAHPFCITLNIEQFKFLIFRLKTATNLTAAFVNNLFIECCHFWYNRCLIYNK